MKAAVSDKRQAIDMMKILVTVIFLISVGVVYSVITLPFQYFFILNEIDWLSDNRYGVVLLYKAFYVIPEELSRFAGMSAAIIIANIIAKNNSNNLFQNLSLPLIMGAFIGLFETMPFLIREDFSSPYGYFSSFMSIVSHGVLTIGAFLAVNEKSLKRGMIIILCIACHLIYNSVGPLFSIMQSDGFDYDYIEQLKWVIRITAITALGFLFWFIQNKEKLKH